MSKTLEFDRSKSDHSVDVVVQNGLHALADADTVVVTGARRDADPRVPRRSRQLAPPNRAPLMADERDPRAGAPCRGIRRNPHPLHRELNAMKPL